MYMNPLGMIVNIGVWIAFDTGISAALDTGISIAHEVGISAALDDHNILFYFTFSCTSSVAEKHMDCRHLCRGAD